MNKQYANASEFDNLRNKMLDHTNTGIGYMQELAVESALSVCTREAEAKLMYSQSILQRNVIPTALLAPSQVGKSTTTTAMLDGRELVPRGKGIGGLRTSSLPITIYHDPYNTKIEISCYTKEELVERIIESAGAHLPEKRTEPYNLDDLDDVALLRAAVEEEIEIFRKQSNYDPSRLDLLKNAILILNFYDCEAHQQLCNGEITSMKDVKKFISFRTDLEVCWERLRDRGFDLMNDLDEDGRPLFGEMENLHVFVRSISLPVHSEFMKETGTAVIDAPGTKMSVEDTRRALKAASDAAVVLFIVSGKTQLTQDDKEMLRTLKAAGLADKMLFAVNFHSPVNTIRRNGIESAILASIREAGYDAPHHQKLLYYNAFLAVRAAQGRLIMNGDLDADTEAVIMADAYAVTTNPDKKFDTVEKAWKYTTLRVLRNIDEDAADALSEDGICEETIRMIEKVSRWNETIQELREYVLQNRAAGVLYDLGARPVYDALTALEKGLEMYEADAMQSEQDATAIYEDARVRLDEYSNRVKETLDDNFTSAIDEALANDYFDEVIMGSIPQVAADAAKAIYNENGLRNNIRVIGAKALQKGKEIVNAVGSWFGRGDLLYVNNVESVKQRCAGIVKNCFENNLTINATKWSAVLYQKPVYESQIEKPVKRVKERLKELWDRLGLKDNELLGNIQPMPVNITGNFAKDVVKAKHMYNSLNGNLQQMGKFNVSPIVSGLMAGMGAIVGLDFVYVCILPLDFIIPGFGTILTVVALAVMVAVAALVQGVKEKQIDKICEELEKSLRAEISKNRNESIDMIIDGTPADPGLKVVRVFYEDTFKQIINSQYAELEQNYMRTLDILKRQKSEREHIAKLAKEWRTEKIAPLRMKVEETIEEVRRIWG